MHLEARAMAKFVGRVSTKSVPPKGTVVIITGKKAYKTNVNIIDLWKGGREDYFHAVRYIFVCFILICSTRTFTRIYIYRVTGTNKASIKNLHHV